MNEMWKQLFVEALLKTSVRSISRTHLSIEKMRILAESATHFLPNHSQALSEKTFQLGQIKAQQFTPDSQHNKTILYFHGGGFCLGSLHTHRALVQKIAQRTQLPIISLDYPLAPETDFPQMSETIFESYLALLETGIQANDIILAGDDSGANLALELMLRLIRQDVERPCGLILLSPFLDLTLTSDSVRYNKKLDALLSPEFLQRASDAYAPSPAQDNSDPRISPLYANFEGLPPTLVQVGSKSLLLDDATRFKTKANDADIELTYKLYTGMWHNFILFNAWFDEAKQALQDIATFTAQFKDDN